MGFFGRKKEKLLPGPVEISFQSESIPSIPDGSGDLRRRVVGNLTIPRRLEELTFVLYQDAFAPVGDLQVAYDNTNTFLRDCVRRGLVVSLGVPSSPSALIESASQHVEIPSEKADALIALYEGAWHSRIRGEHWCCTAKGFDFLTGSAE